MDALIAGAMNSASIEFSLILLTKPGDEVFVKGAVKPILHWIDPSLEIIQVKSFFKAAENQEKESFQSRRNAQTCASGAVIPAISIMLFLPEFGEISYYHIRDIFSRPPWMFHHKIELSSKRTPSFNIARQEYFLLVEGQPLWSVNPVHCGKEHIRICLFARKFHEMVEFYRVVTEREMESTKPGFCTFVLHSNTKGGLEVQLTIKYSPNILPLTLESTFLSFLIKDVRSLHPLFQKEITRLKDNIYKIADPDGNCVILQELMTDHQLRTESQSKKALYHNDANSESQDSGRWSNNGTDLHIVKDTTRQRTDDNTSDLETCSQLSFANSGTMCNSLHKSKLSDKIVRDHCQTYEGVWL